jgi:hypothetical protein
MAATVVVNHSFVSGDRLRVIADVTGDASYPTGGYPLAPSLLGLGTELDVVDANPSLGGFTAVYDYGAQKLKIFAVGGAEVANTTNLTAVTIRLEGVGKGFPVGGP